MTKFRSTNKLVFHGCITWYNLMMIVQLEVHIRAGIGEAGRGKPSQTVEVNKKF